MWINWKGATVCIELSGNGSIIYLARGQTRKVKDCLEDNLAPKLEIHFILKKANDQSYNTRQHPIY